MRIIGIFEAKTHLSEIIKNGEEICITNRGKEVAVIIPFEKYQQNKVKDSFHKLEILKKKIPLGGPQDITQMKNIGLK